MQVPTRLQMFNSLIRRFNEDYTKMLCHYTLEQQIELTEHLLQSIEYIKQYQQSQNDQDWKLYAQHEKALLKNYRSELRHYTEAQFYQYFDFTMVLSTKDILPIEVYNDMEGTEQTLTANEANLFLSAASRYLSSTLQFLYLSDDKASQKYATLSGNDTFIVTDEADKEITKARQLLAIYYLLKASLGIEARDNHATSGIARLIHLLTGTKFTTLQNSDIYKKYLQMPNYKQDVQLIEDLVFIRPYFEMIGLESALKMIEDEKQRAIKALPYHQRNKYKDVS